MATIFQRFTTKTIRSIVLTLAAAMVIVSTARASEKLPADTPLIQACLDLEKDPSDANWERVLGLATALKGAIDKKLDRTPYTKPIDPEALRTAPNSTPGRHTLLNHVRYVGRVPPGPKQSYIHTSAVFINGDLIDASPANDSPASLLDRNVMWNGYIYNSVVVVNGRFSLSYYIRDSIVIAAGPIALGGYIKNSLVISLDSLLKQDDAEELPHRPVRHEEKPTAGVLKDRATVLLRNGYISESVIAGVTACDDLRDSIVIGRAAGREPYLRGAEFFSAGKFARLPWEVKKAFSLDLVKQVRDKSGPQAPADLKVALLDVPRSSAQAAESLARVGAATTRITSDAALSDLKKFDVVYIPAGWAARTELLHAADTLHHYIEGGGGVLFGRPDVGRRSDGETALAVLPFSVTVSPYPPMGARLTRVPTKGAPHPLLEALGDNELPCPYDRITSWDRHWTALVRTEGQGEVASLLVASVGKGRVLLHTGLETYGQQHPGADKFLVAALSWLGGRLAGDEEKLRRSHAADVRQALNDCLIGEADFDAGLLGAEELNELHTRLRRAAAVCPGALVPFTHGHGRRAEIASAIEKTLKPELHDGEAK